MFGTIINYSPSPKGYGFIIPENLERWDKTRYFFHFTNCLFPKEQIENGLIVQFTVAFNKIKQKNEAINVALLY